MGDLGTYQLKVEFTDGTGFFQLWNTGSRRSGGRGDISPLDSRFIPAHFDDEQELIRTILYMYESGNYACDCNRKLFLEYAAGNEVDFEDEGQCGDSIRLKRLTLISPNGTESILPFEEE